MIYEQVDYSKVIYSALEYYIFFSYNYLIRIIIDMIIYSNKVTCHDSITGSKPGRKPA